MNDEQVVEVMALQFSTSAHWTLVSVDPPDPGSNARHVARDVLAALRAEGFDVYRPDDCAEFVVSEIAAMDGLAGWAMPDVGTYRLVPVGGEG